MSRFIAWFHSLQKSRQIALCVCFAHFAAVLWMAIDHCLDPSLPERHPIFVRTIHPAAPPILVKTQHTPSVSSPGVQHSTKPSLPPAKKEKAPIATSTAPKKTRPSQKVAKKLTLPPKKSSIPTKAIQEIEESLNALSAPARPTTLPDLKLPKQLVAKSVVVSSVEDTSFPNEGTSTYHVCLVEALQSSLQLPEVGEVRLKITIHSPGAVASVQILDTKSSKNAEWLKNQLPLIELPSFADFGIVDAFLEFTIMFRNVENL